MKRKMLNRLDKKFAEKKNILNIYFTAGYPNIDSTAELLLALQNSGADIVEIGIPYSDPIADGPVIQHSNMVALQNGMNMELLFKQLCGIKDQVAIPVILMGYLNPVLQYGIENFCRDAEAAGVSGVILPDLPMQEFKREYRKIFNRYGLHFIFLITPETTAARIKKADELSSGFLYAVSSSATTGGSLPMEFRDSYFEKLLGLKLNNPVLIGFGIKDKADFDRACRYAHGAIIGSAFIRDLAESTAPGLIARAFVHKIRG